MLHLSENRGFTLLELLLVVGLIAGLAVIMAPNIAPLVQNIELRSSASSIKYKLLLAKTRALGDSRIRCGVFFDTGSSPQRVQLFFDNVTAGRRNFYDVRIDTAYLEPYVLPPTIRLQITGAGLNRSIVFRGDGSTAVHGMLLTLKNKTNRLKNISVLPSTGRIQITTP
jgi:prepilin-type N-terminal cleavage/methylation domain-containing protein